MTRPERFELPTFGSVDRRSIQLSYGRWTADSSPASAGARTRGRADGVREPAHERARGLELGLDPPVAIGRVEPGPERVAAEDRQLLHPQAFDAGVIGGVALRGALEAGLARDQTGGPGLSECALERGRPASVVDRRAESFELIGGGVVEAGADEQAVERQLEVIAPGSADAGADPERDLLLHRWSGPETGVTVGSKEAGLAEVGQLLGKQACGAEEVVVVARPVSLEPVAVVVVLQFPQEVDGCRRPHGGDRTLARRSAVCGVESERLGIVVPSDGEPDQHRYVDGEHD
jgi:hypothetical protein